MLKKSIPVALALATLVCGSIPNAKADQPTTEAPKVPTKNEPVQTPMSDLLKDGHVEAALVDPAGGMYIISTPKGHFRCEIQNLHGQQATSQCYAIS
ncbi:hypothetical protein [Acetobacter indonesiensis]|uniref:Uncharacterized protein n=1 Tax=Acetobacter indonesiensis TaxID=104101 RepID=A0A6N3T3U3_9PROT|nr:hypothetical protein [Acetobacter indonesiensis]GAN63295.1 hypothetical protein Abin_024_080 [Acetobacter indonesiensis]GEN03876.1 hypothetical protein AIN02nite_19010 [Acetobacter indonesiensis]